MNAWESNNQQTLIRRCVGSFYGENPDMATIKASRIEIAKYIEEKLCLTENDTVLDLGSGFGFIAEALAPKVKRIYCADISQDYLKFVCDLNISNIEGHLLSYDDLSFFKDKINAIYSSALFIHFNIYDISIYLQHFHDILPSKGKVWFDFKNVEFIDNNIFKRHMEYYKQDKSKIVTLLQYNHLDTIRNMAFDIGFYCFPSKNDFVLIKK